MSFYSQTSRSSNTSIDKHYNSLDANPGYGGDNDTSEEDHIKEDTDSFLAKNKRKKFWEKPDDFDPNDVESADGSDF